VYDDGDDDDDYDGTRTWFILAFFNWM